MKLDYSRASSVKVDDGRLDWLWLIVALFMLIGAISFISGAFLVRGVLWAY